jgi:RNA polymerase sigma factor (sigma-70 family)
LRLPKTGRPHIRAECRLGPGDRSFLFELIFDSLCGPRRWIKHRLRFGCVCLARELFLGYDLLYRELRERPLQRRTPIDADVPVAGLGKRLQAGDPAAAEELFARYSQRLIGLARQHLGRKVASREDGEDVVQSVFRTFFRRSEGGEFQIDTSGELWRLLVTITVRKAQAKVRHHTAQQRNVGAEVPGDAALLAEALAREPRPDELVMVADEIDALVRGFPELHSKALALRLQGCSVPEIATGLRVSRRTVERALKLLRDRLARSISG